MANIGERIEDLVPYHYREYAPNLIKFIEKYYEWLYRSGLSSAEILDLQTNQSWVDVDVDKFMETGLSKYVDPVFDINSTDASIIETDSIGSPGYISNTIADNILSENIVGEYTLTTPSLHDTILKTQFRSMGFVQIEQGNTVVNRIDQILMLSLLKHIYAIKGTEQSIKLFFNLFFDEDVTVYYPKFDIDFIDDGVSTLEDGIVVMRDDSVYQEFSYVISVSRDPEYYDDVFNNIYLKLVHPSGFKVMLSNNIETGLGLENGGYVLISDGVYLFI